MGPDASRVIFAVASGAGRAAVTVLRLSGPGCGGVLDRLCRRPPARVASLRTLRNRYGIALDRALVLWLPGPGSFTGEDSAELHLHGGRAVLAGVSGALLEAGARPAEAGEFSRRAFLHGRMDLLQAEAVADLVAAETEAQRRQALRQMEGGLGDLYRGWSARLVRLLAQQEALIDFPDEDLPPSVDAAMEAGIAELGAAIALHLADDGRGERLRDGLEFAIVGAPNVGKSTLINALARRDIAIVSPLAGTTRDVLEVRLDLGGVPVTILDTAGLRDATDAVEAEGVRRARRRAAEADLVLALSDGTPAPVLDLAPERVLHIRTKADLAAREAEGMAISARTGEGMEALETRLAEHARALTDVSASPALTRPRHRAALMEAVERLRAAEGERVPELKGEALRLAVQAIGRITGAVGIEEVLDSVFSQFCIGK